jgi:hypothetical protein
MDYTTDYDGQKKSQIWDSKYGRESQGTRTREWLCRLGPEAIATTDPSSRQRERPISTHPQLSDVYRIPYGNKNLVVSPDGCFIPRQTGRLAIGRNIRLRLRLESLLNLAADKPTTVQVPNCRFLGLNQLRHKLLHYPALTEVPVYSWTYIRVSLCFVKMYNMYISPTLMWPWVE